MQTKTTFKCLFRHTGENSDSAYDFCKVFEDSDAELLTKTRSCCLNWDNDMLVEINEYKVLDVTVIEGMDPKQIGSFYWLWSECGFVGIDPCAIPLDWQRKIQTLKDWQRIACLDLLKVKNFRSEFRKSLRTQLEAWLSGANQYDSPFSSRQWECASSRRTYEVDRIQTSIYRGNRYAEFTGLKTA